jgi:hypothetical protein
LQQACTNLTGTVTTVADCQSVKNAVDAVEMNLLPTVAGAAPVVAPVCNAGLTPTDLFFDDLENPASGNWTHAALTGGDGWVYPPPPGFVNPTSGTKNLYAEDASFTSNYYIARTADVAIPAGSTAFLRFNHSWSWDTDVSSNVLRYWDGGILEYSTNGGGTWQDAGPLISEGSYNGTLRPSPSSNPLASRSAWVGNSDYGSSRVNLSSLAGQPFRFRFRVGTNATIGYDGWFIDDVRVYTCSVVTAPAGITVSPTSGLQTTEGGGTATFTVKLNSVPSAPVTIGLSSSDTSEGTVSPSSLTFQPNASAQTPQTVIVTGVRDAIDDGNVAYSIITAPATSADGSYNGLNPPDVSVTNVQGCSPHPQVGLSNSPAPGGGRLLTITAGSGQITSIQFGTNTHSIVNASIDVPNVGNDRRTAFTATFNPPVTQTTITIRRVAAGGQVMVPMIVTDGCGPWETFFGSGSQGF